MNASKLGRPSLVDAPKALDAVDVVPSVRKFVFAMMDAIMLLVAKIHETVIGLESVQETILAHHDDLLPSTPRRLPHPAHRKRTTRHHHP
jgi:hypothetical protein